MDVTMYYCPEEDISYNEASFSTLTLNMTVSCRDGTTKFLEEDFKNEVRRTMVSIYKQTLSMPVLIQPLLHPYTPTPLRQAVFYPPTPSKPRDIPPKKPCNQPIHRNHHLIPHAHTLCQIRRPPQDPRRPSLELVDTVLVNRAPAAEIRHGAPVAEPERDAVLRLAVVETLAEI